MIVWRESPLPLPVQETIIVSIHVNAAGNGKRWYNATGRELLAQTNDGHLYYSTNEGISWMRRR